MRYYSFGFGLEWLQAFRKLNYGISTSMIRTKVALIDAMKNPYSRLCGHMRSRPSAPWEYSIRVNPASPRTVVHGGAVRAASEAGLLEKTSGDWNFVVYRAKP